MAAEVSVSGPFEFGATFSIGRTIFELRSTAMEPVKYTLGYVFPSTIVPQASFAITFAVDPEAYGRLTRESDSQDTSVRVKEGFSYRVRTRGAERAYVSDLGFDDCPHALRIACRSAVIMVPELTERNQRVPLRIAREVALRDCQAEGDVLMHAACLRVGSVGILIVGPSGSGKTTSLLSLLQTPDSRFISNDRTIVTASVTGVSGRAWPLSVRVGLGTRSQFRQLSVWNTLSRLENDLVHKRIAEDEAISWGSKTKLEFSPLELIMRLQASAEMACNIDCILLPRLDQSDVPISIESASCAAESLRKELLSPESDEYGYGWLGLPTPTISQVEVESRALAKLAALPVLAVRGGSDSLIQRPQDALRALRRAIC